MQAGRAHTHRAAQGCRGRCVPRVEVKGTVQRSIASIHQGYESTQPPEPLLDALLHNDCTGKVPVDKVMSAAAPSCPVGIQAHLSPFSAPLESSQPPFGNWSVIVSAIS